MVSRKWAATDYMSKYNESIEGVNILLQETISFLHFYDDLPIPPRRQLSTQGQGRSRDRWRVRRRRLPCTPTAHCRRTRLLWRCT